MALRCFLLQRFGTMDQFTTDRVLVLNARSPSSQGYHPYLKNIVLILNLFEIVDLCRITDQTAPQIHFDHSAGNQTLIRTPVSYCD